MSYLAEYKKEDFKRVSWNEYNQTLETLLEKVRKYLQENNIKIDAVVPILRGGAFPGTYLTFRLGLLRILSVQYKYFFIKGKIELKKILGVPKDTKLPESPVFLLVENNHCFGLTASTAAKDLKEQFPNCKIIYAVDHVDYSHQKIDNTEVTLYGKLTNETRKLSKATAEEKGLSNTMYLFPWENLEEEWTTVQGKQFEYGDVEPTINNSEKKAVISND